MQPRCLTCEPTCGVREYACLSVLGQLFGVEGVLCPNCKASGAGIGQEVEARKGAPLGLQVVIQAWCPRSHPKKWPLLGFGVCGKKLRAHGWKKSDANCAQMP